MKKKKLVITYNTPIIFENLEDEKLLLETLEEQRRIYNEISKLHYGAKKNSIVDLHQKVYKSIKSETFLPSDIVILTEHEVLAAYKAVKKNKHSIEKPVQKKLLSMRTNAHTYQFRTEYFRFSTLGKRINVKFHIYPKLEACFAKHNLCDPLIFCRDGKFFLALTFEILEPVILKPHAVGIDLGIRVPAATSEGILFKDKQHNAKRRKVRFLKRQLKAKGTKSAKRHLKKLKHKERNINKNFNHHLCNAILKSTKANVIVLEDLTGLKTNLKKKNKYKNMNKQSQVGYFNIRTILTYKAPLHGKRVETVNPSHTSQIDHRTGRKRGVRQGGKFTSKRGLVYHADVNSSINIVKRSKLPFSYSSKNVILGQVTVSTPIVGAPVLQALDSSRG